MFKNPIAVAIIVLGVLAFLTIACGAFMDAGGGPDDDDAPIPDGPDVELAADRRAALALAPPRDPVIGTDQATADRHARLRAFQQREAEIRSAKRWM